ncbi:MAG: hypothetical protein M3Q27_05680 [Actinomycetota bacterium]|nr:hypothetical protein [Actinomycetota bacterium]
MPTFAYRSGVVVSTLAAGLLALRKGASAEPRAPARGEPWVQDSPDRVEDRVALPSAYERGSPASSSAAAGAFEVRSIGTTNEGPATAHAAVQVGGA